jgi:hypothetical protein
MEVAAEVEAGSLRFGFEEVYPEIPRFFPLLQRAGV